MPRRQGVVLATASNSRNHTSTEGGGEGRRGWEGEREGGREEGREEGREGGREGGMEGRKEGDGMRWRDMSHYKLDEVYKP